LTQQKKQPYKNKDGEKKQNTQGSPAEKLYGQLLVTCGIVEKYVQILPWAKLDWRLVHFSWPGLDLSWPGRKQSVPRKSDKAEKAICCWP